jgi:hypothetical protein
MGRWHHDDIGAENCCYKPLQAALSWLNILAHNRNYKVSSTPALFRALMRDVDLNGVENAVVAVALVARC